MKRLFVLGAPDPEMARIEERLTKHGECFVYALHRGPPLRVTPGSAYRTQDLRIPTSDTGAGNLILVECSPPVPPIATVVVVDHHNDGDPGHGRSPAEYLEASSLGQVLKLLGIEATDEDRLVAASDHCPGHAYRGRCPGIDPSTLMLHRIAVKAAFQVRSQNDVMRDVKDAQAELSRAPRNDGVADLRDVHVAELPEAALRDGVAYYATVTDRDGRIKVVVGGNAENQEEIVSDFLSGRVFPTLIDLYGDPSRGYAGGYRP